MQSKFASNCFDAVEVGTGDRVKDRLRKIVSAANEKKRGLGISIHSIDADHSIVCAMAIARKENASEVNERHFLLALLGEESSGTMAALTKALREMNLDMELIRAAAETGRPRSAPRYDYTSANTIVDAGEWTL